MDVFVVFGVLAMFSSLSNGQPSCARTKNNDNGKKLTIREAGSILVRSDMEMSDENYSSSIDEETEMDINIQIGIAIDPIFEISDKDIPDLANANATNNTKGMPLNYL